MIEFEIVDRVKKLNGWLSKFKSGVRFKLKSR